MTALPSGFCRRVEDGATAVLRADLADALLVAGLSDPESLRSAAEVSYRGRGRPFGVQAGGAGRVFVRPYLHGGLLRRVTGDLHASDARFLSELRTLLDAREAGVAVCEPLGVVSRSAGLGFRRGWLLLRELPGSRDLLHFLTETPQPSVRRRVLENAGRAIRALHDAGFEHPDLHLKNLLLVGDTVLVLDLDRSRRRGSLSRRRRIAGLFRLDRHAAKQAARGAVVSRTDRLRLLRAYAGAEWPQRTERRALAKLLARHIARHRALRTHRRASAAL